MLKWHFPSYLVLKHWSTKSPDSSKDKVKFIELFGTVGRCVFLCQEAFQEVAQHLNHTLLRNGNNLLKPKGWQCPASQLFRIQAGKAGNTFSKHFTCQQCVSCSLVQQEREQPSSPADPLAPAHTQVITVIRSLKHFKTLILLKEVKWKLKAVISCAHEHFKRGQIEESSNKTFHLAILHSFKLHLQNSKLILQQHSSPP